ncbi:MAG: helix-turn-helix transcriptional regulator [Undibacterium sp.]|nr:helix-turn-helix transcriptional regulator [Opitutaceae bacterium]
MTFHSIERLGHPFASVSELGLVIPRDSEMLVRNPEVKLLFFLQAECEQEIDGVGRFPMKAGDICVVPRLCLQHYRLVRPRDLPRIHVLKISLGLPPLPAPGQPAGKFAVKGNPESDLGAFCQHHFTEIRHLPAAQDAPMQEIMLAIRREAEEHRAGIRHRVRALCTNLLVHVARRLHDSPAVAKATAAGHGFVVNQAKEFLRRNFAQALTLGEIAWHVKMSEEHLARVFRKVTGQTVFDYLRTVRLESAKTLLIDSSQTLTEIAALTGFGSLSLFSRNFSQYVGQSPSAYRQARAQSVQW